MDAYKVTKLFDDIYSKYTSYHAVLTLIAKKAMLYQTETPHQRNACTLG